MYMFEKVTFAMDCIKTIVADTYLAYSENIGGAEAYRRFVSKEHPLQGVWRDPSFDAFSEEELIDEMTLLEKAIRRVVIDNVLSFGSCRIALSSSS